MNSQDTYWSGYYTGVMQEGNAWLDYSNARVQAQTFSLALEAAGPVRGLKCIDLGCGWGDFCRLLVALGAAEVTGVDMIPATIAKLKQTDRSIRWICSSLCDPHLGDELESYDVTFLLEVLQYLPLADSLHSAWVHLKPGGRLIGVAPNARCPIVRRTRERFDSLYAPVTVSEIGSVVQTLSDVDHATYRALSFGEDQRLVPYEVSPWRPAQDWPVEPNRIQFAVVKRNQPTV
jgi:2-polyprenyl-3-methyl-5-hydroxy-6-metoxy-1,4-benzoquinol methylase